MRQETGHQGALLLGDFVTLRNVAVNGKNRTYRSFGGMLTAIHKADVRESGACEPLALPI